MIVDVNILNEFASKIISDGLDITIEAIKKADKNRNARNQTIDTRIYQVTIDALNKFPYNNYKKKEKVYDAAESILKELKRGNGGYKESVRTGLNMLSSDITEDRCEDFLKLLCDEICREENRDLAIMHIIHQGEQVTYQQKRTNRYLQEGFENSHQNEEQILGKLNELKEDINNQGTYKTEQNKIPIKNRAQDYADKWNKNVFLNDFKKRDKRKGENIKLREIYLEEHLPHYVWKSVDEPLDDLRDLLSEYIVDKDDKKMFLILGQPGIGKSTLITWVMVNLVKKQEEILVYQFASDLRHVNWQSDNILDDIFRFIDYDYRGLEGKTLILDGFDEIDIKDGNRGRILNKMNQELKKMNFMKEFSLIITCRQNYVEQEQLESIDYITLQAWDEEQIKSFCEIYETENTRENPEAVNSKNLEIKINKILENKEVFGIPLILYMVLALKIDVEKSSSKVDIYDQIFSLKKGGIYDRCYDMEHRTNLPGIKEHIHQVSQRIAFWIFENNSEKASISQKEFEKICDNVIKEAEERIENLQSDVLIGNYFTAIRHCEGIGTNELQFIHRSIYEYFVAVYFYESIYKLKSKEEVAGKLGELLKEGRLSKQIQILEFIKYKCDSMEGYNLSSITKEIFNLMLRDGMTYHVEKKYKNIIVRERNIFSNMLEIVCLWNPKLGKLDGNIVLYLQCNHLNRLSLSGAYLFGAYLFGAYLSGADLSGADLSGADLRGADLSGADLRGADLSRVDLIGADLRGADLSGADLSEAYLSGANLDGVVFDEEQVDLLGKKYDLSNSRVYISKIIDIVSYKEYCMRKKKI